MASLLLHEVVDVVGEGAMPYMEHVVRFDADAAADRSLGLVGSWYVTGSTGRWPQVVNLWEVVGGWDGWRALMDATNLRRTRNPALTRWWREALEHRSGGFDRLLRARGPSPTLEQLRADGRTGSLFVHELSRVRPGAAPEYLDAVGRELVPLLAEYGHWPVVLGEVCFTDVEVCTIWGTSPDDHVRRWRAADDRLDRWRATAREFLTDWREELMTPAPGSLLSAGDTL